MNEKNQIEEMAKLICSYPQCVNYNNIGGCVKSTCQTVDFAENLYKQGYRKQEWISVEERLPEEWISVLGYMTDAGDYPSVRECYRVGRTFFFPSLSDRHPVSHWMPLPEPPKMKGE